MMARIAFITGITGQDGSYLAEFLLEKNYIVYGMIRRMSTINTIRIDHILDRLRLCYGDMTDSSNIIAILHKIKDENPNMERLEIYNLAAQSHVKISFELPEFTTNTDALGTLRLLDAIRTCDLEKKVRLYQASTSELFGSVQEIPQKETTPFYPRSPYAVAKLFAHWIVKNYREAYGMYACSGILFNHESPRRGENFVTRKITIGLGQIIRGEEEYITLGNLDSKRDWGHAKDYVRAMWLMLQQNKPDDYVIATGRQYTVREFVERVFIRKGIRIQWEGQGTDEVGRDAVSGRILIRIHERYYRPSEVDTLLGDASKGATELGWQPEISFDELIDEMVNSDCAV